MGACCVNKMKQINKEDYIDVVNPNGKPIRMYVCPYPKLKCVWCMYFEQYDKYLCDKADELDKNCCECTHNTDWQRGVCVNCNACALNSKNPLQLNFDAPSQQLIDMELATIDKWDGDEEV